MKIPFFLIFCLLCASCVNNRNEINKFLYLSQDGILHSDKDCKNISTLKYKGITINGVKFIDTTGVTDKMFTAICPECFSDKQYEHLREIIRRNNEQNIIVDSSYTIINSKIKSKYTDYYQVIINGKFVNVPKSEIDKQGWDNYAQSHPGAKLRMRDENNTDYDVPFTDISRMQQKGGLRPYTIRSYTKRNKSIPI